MIEWNRTALELRAILLFFSLLTQGPRILSGPWISKYSCWVFTPEMSQNNDWKTENWRSFWVWQKDCEIFQCLCNSRVIILRLVPAVGSNLPLCVKTKGFVCSRHGISVTILPPFSSMENEKWQMSDRYWREEWAGRAKGTELASARRGLDGAAR